MLPPLTHDPCAAAVRADQLSPGGDPRATERRNALLVGHATPEPVFLTDRQGEPGAFDAHGAAAADLASTVGPQRIPQVRSGPSAWASVRWLASCPWSSRHRSPVGETVKRLIPAGNPRVTMLLRESLNPPQ